MLFESGCDIHSAYIYYKLHLKMAKQEINAPELRMKVRWNGKNDEIINLMKLNYSINSFITF